MDESKKYRLKLSGGTSVNAMPDGAGNYIVDGIVEKDIFSEINLNKVVILDGGSVIDTAYNQILRTYYTVNGNTFIRFSDMTEIELIQADYNAKIDYIACMTEVDLDE